MDVKIEIKIKVGKDKQVVLSGDDAKELYYRLKEIYGKYDYTVTYPYPYIYPYQYPLFTQQWTTSSGTCIVSCEE
jgi:hypothetical protein